MLRKLYWTLDRRVWKGEGFGVWCYVRGKMAVGGGCRVRGGLGR